VKEKISVGDSVEVYLNTGLHPFKGTVTAAMPPVGTYEFSWYRVEPESASDMPGHFWYKDTEVQKDRDDKKAKASKKSARPRVEQPQERTLQRSEEGKR